MKKLRGVTKRITAMMLSGMFIIGSASGSVFASSTDAEPRRTNEVAIEETSSEEVVTQNSMKEPVKQETQYYTIILDANGGYFVNEWDDSIGDYVERGETVTKQIPVGEGVAVVPVFRDQDGKTMAFAGWRLEPDGGTCITDRWRIRPFG